MSDPILVVKDLKKKYGGDLEAVKGINFSVEEGEVFGLLGPNGAGETQSISMSTGLVPQDLALYPILSARANLEFFGRIYGLRGRDLKERVEDVLRIASLEDRADQAIDKYSGGMKRRINIAAPGRHPAWLCTCFLSGSHLAFQV